VKKVWTQVILPTTAATSAAAVLWSYYIGT